MISARAKTNKILMMLATTDQMLLMSDKSLPVTAETVRKTRMNNIERSGINRMSFLFLINTFKEHIYSIGNKLRTLLCRFQIIAGDLLGIVTRKECRLHDRCQRKSNMFLL